jgi:tripartite-type tricarboxylate transporter receptor subunit TctC
MDRWNVEIVKVLKSPDVVSQLNEHGLTPMPTSREELAKYMVKESATWGKLIREKKITGE